MIADCISEPSLALGLVGPLAQLLGGIALSAFFCRSA